ncbi:MAG: alpha/beta hydrolase [Mesorhizobium sp.]|nr:MAG: alpha/beta hydrolase [Mesorhizobium sp.]
MASFGLKVIRGVFAAAEHVAPRLTGRAAFELFCRTPNAKILSDGERRAVDRAAGFMAEARHHRLKTKNGCVMAHESRPEPGRRAVGTVLVIHGWRSRTEYMRTLIEGYRDAGYKVVSLDLPGHGQSQGRRLTLVSAVEAARLTGEWFGPCSLPAIFNDFSRMLSVGPRSQAAMADRVERIAGRPLHEFVGDRQLARTPVPTLVIHAPDDREVSADHARLYAGAGDHVTLYWADGLGHRRILADKGVVERAIDFVAEHREPVSLH